MSSPENAVTLNLKPEEATVVAELCAKKGLTPEQLLRQGLRVYQAWDEGHLVRNPELAKTSKAD